MTEFDWKQEAAKEYGERRAALVERHQSSLAEMERLAHQANAIAAEIAELDHGAKVFGLAVPQHEVALAGAISGSSTLSGALTVTKTTENKPPQFKDIALECLKDAYPNPLKAADIQAAAEKRLGRQFHWKTAGMTLYRLKQDGLAERQGQKWFYKPSEQPDLEDLLA